MLVRLHCCLVEDGMQYPLDELSSGSDDNTKVKKSSS